MMKTNDFSQVKTWLNDADAVLITASNGLSISEGYHIFADNDDFKKYFGDFRKKYGIDCLIRGVFEPLPKDEHARYMRTVHRYMIDDYHGSDVMKNLLSLVKGKDYFIITSNADTHFQMNGFDADRIFEIEGNFDGLAEGGTAWFAQRERFNAFYEKYAGNNVLLFELGIGAANQMIKGPTMALAAQNPSWRYVTMNMPREINVPETLTPRTVAVTGDITASLKALQ